MDPSIWEQRKPEGALAILVQSVFWGMSLVYFVSDLHLGHRRIVEFTRATPNAYRGGNTVEEHDEWIVQQLLAVKPDKRTLWWILGDVCMGRDKGGSPAGLELLRRVPGRKRLVLGNHDLFPTATYLKYFESVHGTIKKYGVWLSHCPVHPHELRGLPNVHGHCHQGPIQRGGYGDAPDGRYLNLAIDWAPGHGPVSIEFLREHFGDQIKT